MFVCIILNTVLAVEAQILLVALIYLFDFLKSVFVPFYHMLIQYERFSEKPQQCNQTAFPLH